jgi:hypothetical protein
MFHTPWDAREESDRQAERKTETGRQRQGTRKKTRERREKREERCGGGGGKRIQSYCVFAVCARFLCVSERQRERESERKRT